MTDFLKTVSPLFIKIYMNHLKPLDTVESMGLVTTYAHTPWITPIYADGKHSLF